VVLLRDSVFFNSCPIRARRVALTSLLSLRSVCDISVDVFESTDFVEVVERVGDDLLVGE